MSAERKKVDTAKAKSGVHVRVGDRVAICAKIIEINHQHDKTTLILDIEGNPDIAFPLIIDPEICEKIG